MELKNWLDTQLGQDIWTRKYQNGDETFDQWLDRVSNGDDAVKDLILSKKFIFGGRILASRGITDRKVTYSNCYVLPPVGDSIEEIYDTNKYLARTFSYGGGCGIDISQLRPKGSPVNNAALTTTGAVSFMETFNNTSQTIGQKGRRGALMISMDVNHAEIEDFINAKTQNKKLEECNISVRTDDLFMTRVIAGDGNANNLMYKLAENNWNWGEPGMLFWDNINKETLLSEYIKKGEFEFAGVNPCAEEPLPAGGSCLLGSLNLAEFVKDPFGKRPAFDIPSFKQAVKVAIRALNQVLDEGLPLHPLQIQRDSVAKWRQIGLGIMGFGDMLIKMRIPYGSDRCSNLIATIGMALCNTGLQESALLAKELGTFEAYNLDYILNSFYIQSKIKEGVIYEETIDLIKAYGLRNSQLFTIAPTGSIGTMFGVSTGVEPIYDVNGFARTTKSLNAEDKVYMEYPNIVQRAIEADDIDMLNNKPAYLIGAKDLDFMSRVKTQADWQVWIDASISSTLNLPKESPVEDVFKAYIAAHELGCKGLTVFRDGCKKEGILKGVAKEEKPEPTQLNAIDTDINHCIAFGSKLQTGCGSLWMTVYFHKKTGQLCHIFLNKGSKGGCNSYMVGLSRLISLAGKKGATVEEIVDQLKSVVACPSFVSRKTTEANISDGRSCAEAVGRELLKLHEQFKINYLNQPEITQLKIGNEVKIEIAKCPECGAELSHTGGCINCYNCGWTKCD
jgi:ribonucleoside-diphosphate reductase alpha chain